jgi:ABC-type amino acid transport substrate-binding protein
MQLTPKHFLLAAGVIALLLIAGLLLSAGTGASKPKDETWNRIQQTRTLRVGLDASYPPFENLDDGGNIVGFDVDLAHELGERLDVQIVLVNFAYDGLSDALLSGQVDVLISALTAPPQLEGKAWFSTPYFNAGDSLVVRPSSTIQAMADLEGRSLAVEYGSGGDVEARKWERRLAALTVKRYPLANAALDAVAAGEADAALVDGIAARLAIGQQDRLAMATYVTDAHFVIVAPEDSPTLHRQINDTLQDMLQDGTIDQLILNWFGPQNHPESTKEGFISPPLEHRPS